jgi:hypothetical protein
LTFQTGLKQVTVKMNHDFFLSAAMPSSAAALLYGIIFSKRQ